MGSERGADFGTKPEIESGLELLARLGEKPTRRRLEDTLFPRGLRAGDTVEITGDASTGKTLLLSRIIAKCILPARHGQLAIGGCDARAVLIDAKHHFQLSRLIDIMAGILRNVEESSSCRVIDEKTARSIVESSVKNLTIIECYHGAHLESYLASLESIFLQDDNLALLAIDGINAFYWERREVASIGGAHIYISNLLNVTQVNTSRYGLVTVYTRSRIATRQTERMERTKRQRPIKHVSHSIRLRKTRRVKEYVCSLRSKEDERQMCYAIGAEGLRWDGTSHAHENARKTAPLE